ncbi:MAG: 4-hydroxy-tetrahydrodipicolinate reductase [Clostridia bacterium]|nr:4-hydroxy-tetrahydrodipicolinate reductase [Clostridia bacterium]
MTSILLCGAFGRMGKNVADFASASNKAVVSAGVDVSAPTYDAAFPVFSSLDDVTEQFDVIVDFSHHTAVRQVTETAVAKGVPAVIAATGHDDAEKDLIRKASLSVPVFYSGNMSLGINLLIDLAKTAARTLGSDFDIEIVEEHHNRKADAPSGTALMIADAINSDERFRYVYDRHSSSSPRKKDEIGIHSVRGGNIVGEHEVIFAGESEVIRISHSAASRMVFAEGAVNAACWIVGKEPGLYGMSDMIRSRGI